MVQCSKLEAALASILDMAQTFFCDSAASYDIVQQHFVRLYHGFGHV